MHQRLNRSAQSESKHGNAERLPVQLGLSQSSQHKTQPMAPVLHDCLQQDWVQPKLVVGAAGDRYEQEADRVASAVVQRLNSAASSPLLQAGSLPIQRLQRQSLPARPGQDHQPTSPELTQAIQQRQGQGQPLPADLRSPLETAFGRDFTNVRIHTDARSHQMNQFVQSSAFTTGRDIFFRGGSYRPHSTDGKALLAHELTHVVQQEKNPGRVIQRKETGISKEVAVSRFTGAAKTIKDQWGTLTINARAEALGKLANAELKTAGSHPCNIVVKDLGADSGQFLFSTWTLAIANAGIIAKDAITDDEMAEVLDTVYHEARHSEQWFRMARLRAGEGKTAAEIAREMGIPNKVAKAAFDKPLKPLTGIAKQLASKAKIAAKEQKIQETKNWYDSVYGKDRAARNTTLVDLRTKFANVKVTSDALTLARQETDKAALDYTNADAASKPALLVVWQAKHQQWQNAKVAYDQAVVDSHLAHALYKALPEEADAWAVGGRIQDAYKKKIAKKP
jgi:Domain of unknown function (DUF4157)